MTTTMPETTDTNLTLRVRKALQNVRPYLLADGGDVELVGIAEGVATVALKGNCAGCPMSTQTLRLGIEKYLKEQVPEITAVQQASAGHVAAPQPVRPPEAEIKPGATRFLRAEHAQLKALLKRLDEVLSLIATKGANEGRREIATLRQIRQFLAGAFCEHMRVEEEVLFPALEGKITWGQPTKALRRDHELLHTGIEQFGSGILAFELGGPEHLLRVSGQLSRLLRDHMFREENTLYFEADESLPADAVRRLQENAKCFSAAS